MYFSEDSVGAESRPLLAYDVAQCGGFKMSGAGTVKKRKLFEGPPRVFALQVPATRHPPACAGEAGSGRDGAHDCLTEIPPPKTYF